LAGYQVDSLKVTLTDGSFHPVDSDALSFELAARMGYREVAKAAGGAVILEPIMKMEVITPEENMGDIVGDIRRGQLMTWVIERVLKLLRQMCHYQKCLVMLRH
jgi:elongation factor G